MASSRQCTHTEFNAQTGQQRRCWEYTRSMTGLCSSHRLKKEPAPKPKARPQPAPAEENLEFTCLYEDVEDLKEQVKALQETIARLEAKQTPKVNINGVDMPYTYSNSGGILHGEWHQPDSAGHFGWRQEMRYTPNGGEEWKNSPVTGKWEKVRNLPY